MYTLYVAHSHLMSLSSPFFCQKSRKPPSSAQSTFFQHPVAWLSDSRACWCVWLWSEGQPWPPNWSAATRGDRQQPVDLEPALASLASALTHSLVLHLNHADSKHPKPRASRLFTCPVSCWLHTNMEDWYIPDVIAKTSSVLFTSSINLLTGLVF